MELKQLRYFLHIADLKSFSKAAVVLGLSQTVLSRQIKALEKELKAELFYRNGRGVVLSESGKLLLGYATVATESVDRASTEIASLASVPTGKVAVAFSGDGASNQGTTFEALNMAVVLKVPAIFVFENNGYGEHTASSYAVGGPSIVERAKSFGMPGEVVDGSDFFAVREAMGRALERGRANEGPYALEIVCSRFTGHFVGDPQAYRLPEEVAKAKANDPIPRFRNAVTEAALLEHADLDAIEQEVLAEVEDAVQVGMAANRPSLSTLEKDVYVRY